MTSSACAAAVLTLALVTGAARADFMPVPPDGGPSDSEHDDSGYRPDEGGGGGPGGGGPGGGASPGGWSASFTNDSSSSFTHLAVIMLNGSNALAEPGIANITGAASWSSVTTTVSATGDTVAIASDFGGDSTWTGSGGNIGGGDGYSFSINFTSMPTESVMFMIVGYDSDDDYLDASEVIDADLAVWDGLEWSMFDIGYHGGNFHPLSLIPLPSPLALAAMGLTGLVLARGRIRRLVT